MDLLLVSLVGGLLALDATAVGQFMVSRPLVAGALAGWVLGDPALGLGVGAVLELYLLVSFPSGGARFPEGATATVVAVAAALPMAGEPGALPMGVAVGLVWGQVGGASITVLRRLNGRLVPDADAERVAGLERAHLGAVALDGVRGALITFAGAAAGRWAVGVLAPAWPLGFGDSLGLLLVGGAVSGGILLRDFGGFRRHRVLFAAGMALGLVGARFL